MKKGADLKYFFLILSRLYLNKILKMNTLKTMQAAFQLLSCKCRINYRTPPYFRQLFYTQLLFIRMKKCTILLTLAIAVFSCKNDSKTETAGAPPASDAATQPQSQPALNLTEVRAALEKAKVTVEEIKMMRKQIDALPANIKTSNADNIENLRSTLEGMEEKETYFIMQLNEALSAINASTPVDGPSADRTAAIMDAVQTIEGFAEDLKWMKGQVEMLSEKQ